MRTQAEGMSEWQQACYHCVMQKSRPIHLFSTCTYIVVKDLGLGISSSTALTERALHRYQQDQVSPDRRSVKQTCSHIQLHHPHMRAHKVCLLGTLDPAPIPAACSRAGRLSGGSCSPAHSRLRGGDCRRRAGGGNHGHDAREVARGTEAALRDRQVPVAARQPAELRAAASLTA